MKHKIKLLRIFFRHHVFKNEDENKYHYLFHQISLLLKAEFDPRLKNNLKSLLISFGTKKLWLKYYKTQTLPILHWYKIVGSSSAYFNYDSFFKLEFEEQKKYVFDKACEQIRLIAEYGSQKELLKAIEEITVKYKSVEVLNTDYIAFRQIFFFDDSQFEGKVIFSFSDKISVYLKIYKAEKELSSHLITTYNYGYIEWVITAFKKIEIDGNMLILKGHKDMDELPFRIDISDVAV